MADIFAADIGGTNSRFAHFTEGRDGELSLVKSQWLRTKESSSFEDLIGNLGRSGFQLSPGRADIAVIAVAGPVERNVYSSPPFIDWDIDISSAEKDLGFKRCVLINDFVAQAFACRSPIGRSAGKVLDGEDVSDAASAVIGAGTGLGKAALVPDRAGGFIAVPSEGGHANFPFVSKKEFEFQEFLLKELGEAYIIYNFVVSGQGLSRLHQFLTGKKVAPEEMTALLSGNSETLEWASRFYARACRNYALEVLALCGVFIAGGVAARTPGLLEHEAFGKEFRSSGTMSAILEKIPVFLIADQDSGLWGAGLLGLQTLKRDQQQRF